MKIAISLLMTLLTTSAFATEDADFFSKAFSDNQIQVENVTVTPSSNPIGFIANSLVFLDELGKKMGSDRLVLRAKNVSVTLSGETVQCDGWIGTQKDFTEQERYVSISDCDEMELKFMGVVSLESGASFRPTGITIRPFSF